MWPRESEVCPQTEFTVTIEKCQIPNTKDEEIDNLCSRA